MSSILSFSNITAMAVRRRLDDHTLSVSRSSERLASGLRINRASDDAAGLAISSMLRADSRVYAQGLRNVNDAISALNIADGAVGQFQNILGRLKELATSSANGVYSLNERRALDTEAYALTNEFNRLAQTVRFNNLPLLSTSNGSFSVQLGYGSSNSIGVNLGSNISRTIGTGTFTSSVSIANSETYTVANGDVNGDGKEDIVGIDYTSGDIKVYLGNGNGTFGSAVVSSAPLTSVYDMALADMNNDGALDVVTSSIYSTSIAISFNQGGGSFGGSVTFVHGGVTSGYDLKIADINGDGRKDVITASPDNGAVGIFASTGSGVNFTTSNIYLGPFAGIRDVNLGDFNGDGKLDIVAASGFYGGVDLGVSLFLGNGNGTFGARRTLNTSFDASSATNADLNHDGYLDLIVATANERVQILLGNGNGTFRVGASYAAGATLASPYEYNQVIAGDINGDGIHDLVSGDYDGGSIHVLIGRGDGTFNQAVSYTTNGHVFSFSLADFNGDGAKELLASGYDFLGSGDAITIFNPQTQTVASMQRIDLMTQQAALDSLSIIDQAMLRVSKELGAIGTMQSRLNVAAGVLGVTRENYLAADSRISDVDVASESANLVRSQILQQTAAALSSQANLMPELLLSLLRN